MQKEGGFALKVDADLFRRLLDLNTHELITSPIDVVLLQNPFNASAVIENIAPTHGEGGEQGGGESSGATTGALSPSVEPAAQLAQAPVGDDGVQNADVLAAALGLTGLVAVQRPSQRTSGVQRKKRK